MKTWLSHKLVEYWPYLLATVAVLGPLLMPGYVLTMDMVFVPHPPIPSEVNASYPFYVLLHYLSYVIPGDVLQKIVLLSILVLAGVGMHRLLREQAGSQLSRWVIVAASLFYMLSAFVYERLMMGQFAVVAGYALLPFYIVSLQYFLRQPSWEQLARLSAWVIGISIVSVHALVPLAVISVFVTVTNLNRNNWQEIGKKMGVGVLVILVVSSYWIIPAIAGTNTIGAAIAGSSPGTFNSQGGLFSLLRLQGFWAENRELFLMPQQISLLPGVWQTLLWVAVIAGFVRTLRRERNVAVIYGSSIIAGCIIALIGLTEAYREPHKIVVLAALGMAVLAAFGAQSWLDRAKSKQLLVTVSIIVVPLMLGLAMFWGFWGQLSARDYPGEWYALNQKMQELPDDKPAVFVPWHLYQRYSFSPRITANPAATFFQNRQVIVSNNPEFAGLSALQSDNTTDAVDRILTAKLADAATQFNRLGIGYLIFAREPGYEEYEFLRGQAGFRRIFNDGRLELYKIEVRS